MAQDFIVWNVRDATADDTDKSFSPPTGTAVIVDLISVTYVSTGTAGNRQLEIQVKNSAGDVVYDKTSQTNQSANNTYQYEFAPGLPEESSATNDEVQGSIPQSLWIEPGGSIRIFDSATVDAAADDMTVYLIGRMYQ